MAVDVPPNILAAHYAAMLHASERLQGDLDIAIALHRNTALHGLKTVEAVAAYELLVSNDANERARINAAARVPTTLSQPSAGVQ